MKSKFFIILLLLLSIPGCDFFTDPEEGSTATEKVVIDNGIEYSMSVPTNVFSIRDSLVITFRVKNNTLLPKRYYFANVQQFGFQLTNSFNRVVLYRPFIVAPATSSFTINPGETKTLTGYSMFTNNNGNYISTGNYILTGYLLDRNSPQLTLRITVQ